MAKRVVLIAIDKSKEAAYAVDWALGNLIQPGDQVTLLHVAKFGGFLSSPNKKSAQSPQSDSKADPDFLVEAETKLRKNETIQVQKVIRAGDARTEICAAVEDLKASLLVMASRGASLLKKALLTGSVSDYCTVNAACPVTVVKPKSHKKKDAA